MDNASDGCAKNPDDSAVLPKPQFDDSKSKYVSPYVNKPIFRRKLIEKYSTARYNINTKRILVRKSSSSQIQCNVKQSKDSPKNASLRVENDEKPEINPVTKSDSSNEIFTAALPSIHELAGDEDLLKSSKSSNKTKNVTSETAISDKTYDKKYSSSFPGSRKSQIISNSPQDSQLTRKRKFISAPVSNSCSKVKWRIAPKSVYNQLCDLYQSAEAEPKKETKKRVKCHWTKKRSRKKTLSVQETVADKIHFDPYNECLKEANAQSLDTSRGQSGDKLGIVMYLGVNRPIFPLVYRNLRVLNDSNDATITDFWAEFTLSTLITKTADKKCKPILVPVKDPELVAIVSECLKEAVIPSVSNVSGARSAKVDDAIKNNVVSQVSIKKEENDCVPVKKRKYNVRSLDTKPKTPKTYGLRANSYKKLAKKESKMISCTKLTTTRRRAVASKTSPIPVPVPAAFTHVPFVIPTSTHTSFHTPAPIDTHTSALICTSTSGTSPVPSITAPGTAFTSPGSKPKPKNRAIRTKKPVLDEKAILKKFGYKECLVAIPKLSDTLIKYLSAGNYSNESAQLSDPTERELIEETDNFGLIQCSRTDGIIIDYVKRNRSLVYFYKLKKMLDFQKTNNKYFVCCDYMLIDRSDAGESDDDVIVVQEENSSDDHDKFNRLTSRGPRNSRNPNDLFKMSKFSEWKNKSNRISWVKNHDLKFVSDVKWLLISLEKHVTSLSHVSGCVLRYRLLFEIIYRAELSKKVICCEISSPSATSAGYTGSDNDNAAATKAAVHKLTFGVYAFPGLCDKVLAGPYLFHEEHHFSASIRTNDGGSEYAHIRTLEEKENFPRTDDSTPVKHINAKWWSGKKTTDLTEQYLNFFFNPSPVKCAQLTDKLCLTKIIAEHPCHNYHSYEITGRENNLVLFHDRTNHIEKTVITSIEPSTTVQTDNKTDQTLKLAAHAIPPKSSRNLRKKPRRDYSRLVTGDMMMPAKTKNLEFHIVDVKSLRRRRNARREEQTKQKRSRYQESPQTHIMNERMRRLEFRNHRNNLATVLKVRSSSDSRGNSQSLVSILNQAREIVAYLEIDNNKLDEEGKRLRVEQSVMMRKFLALLRNLDINSAAYKEGIAFVVSWKKIKAEHRNKLITILGQNVDEQKSNRVAESSRNGRVDVTETTSMQQLINNRAIRHSMLKKFMFEVQTAAGKAELELKERQNQHFKGEDTAQRSKFRKQKRQKLRNALRMRSNPFERCVTDSLECEISEEVVCESGKLSDPLSSNHILDRMGEVPVIIPNIPSNVDPYAIDPLADDDSDHASPPPGGYSTSEKKEPSHPLYYEHSYCSLEDEPLDKSSNLFEKGLPQIKNVYSQRVGYRPIRPFRNNYKTPISSAMVSPCGYRPNRPIINNSAARTPIRTQMPAVTAPSSPCFQIRVSKSAEENLGIDILDNGRMFARLNIAKVNSGNDVNYVGSSSHGVGARVTGEMAGASTSNKIMNIIQRFLLQMEKASPSNEANDDERAKQAKRRHVVNSLKSFISKFESRRQPSEDAGYFSSRASNSDDTSPPCVTDSIELESGYSSKSEESCDPDCESNTNEPDLRNLPADGQIIENTIFNDADGENHDGNLEIESQKSVQVQEQDEEEGQEPVEVRIEEQEEHVLREDEFIAEEEEEEEIIGEEEFIEEEEEEEEIVGGNTLEEMNDVDAAMRGDQDDCFADFDDSLEGAAPLVIEDDTNIVLGWENDWPPVDEEESSMLPTSSVLHSTNQFTIIKSKNKFVPNIIKTPTKVVVDATSVSDHLSRIQVKPSVGLVKLSTASMQLTTNETPPIPSSSSNDSIIKRLWYSPVTKTDQANLKVLRRESFLNESVKISDLQSEKPVDEEDKNEEANSNDDTKPSIEKDHNGANRIIIKSFANHDKFKEAFVSNVDKLLNPES